MAPGNVPSWIKSRLKAIVSKLAEKRNNCVCIYAKFWNFLCSFLSFMGRRPVTDEFLVTPLQYGPYTVTLRSVFLRQIIRREYDPYTDRIVQPEFMWKNPTQTKNKFFISSLIDFFHWWIVRKSISIVSIQWNDYYRCWSSSWDIFFTS